MTPVPVLRAHVNTMPVVETSTDTVSLYDKITHGVKYDRWFEWQSEVDSFLSHQIQEKGVLLSYTISASEAVMLQGFDGGCASYHTR